MATAKVKGNSFSLKRHASDAMDEGTMPGIALAIGENGWKSWSPSNQGALSRTKAAAPASPQDAVFPLPESERQDNILSCSAKQPGVAGKNVFF